MSEQVIGYEVKGLAELEANLRALGDGGVAAKWVNGGLRAGVVVIQKGAQQREAPHNKTGLLYSTIRVRRKKASDDKRADYFVFAGSRVKGGGGAYYAHMVERGTRPHVIKAKAGGLLYFGGAYHAAVQHPGSKGVYYLEGSLRANSQAAIDAMATYIRGKLSKPKFDPNA